MSMELDNSFTVPTSPDRAWAVLLDVERIAPCMPGATVEEFDGEVVTGRIKVKVGPVSLTYRGTAKFIERDPDARLVVLEAAGKETRGAGTAAATVRASLEPESSADSTRVVMHTTMNVTGRPAQFGRGVIAEVGSKLVEKFAENLAQQIAGGSGDSADISAPEADAQVSAAAPAGPDVTEPSAVPVAAAAAAPVDTPVAVAAPTVADPADPGAEDSLNLVRLVGPAILKRVLPVAVAAAAIVLLGRRVLRRARKA